MPFIYQKYIDGLWTLVIFRFFFRVFLLVSSDTMNCKVVLLVCLIVVQSVNALPFFFGIGNRQYDGNSRGRDARTGRSYNDIARVINPNPYGNIGGVPFPAQPFWTYG